MQEKNIKLDEFQRICRLAKLVEVRADTFATTDKSEGIFYRAGKLITFRFADSSREECDVTSIQSKDILAVSGAFELKNRKGEQIEEIASKKAHDDLGQDLSLELPEIFTSALISKWGTMGTIERILLFQHTPKSKIQHVKVGKDTTAPYVKGNYMFKEANAAFLFDWFLSDIDITTGQKGVSVTGKLNAWFSEYNKYLQRPATGYQELNQQVDAELARKGATTDAIKKGLSLFGFNSDVYSEERERRYDNET